MTDAEKIQLLTNALVGLIGSDDKAELKRMRKYASAVADCNEQCSRMVYAIDALISVLD
jgi:hypothetical protein